MRVVLILGMHRSGTSAVAGCFREAGLYMGDVLEMPTRRNPGGHQEPPSIIRLHDHILHANGGSWDAPPDQLVWSDFHKSVRDLFIESRRQNTLWGFKEPRTLLMLDNWTEALPGWRGVGVFRDPRYVVASLSDRNRFPVAQGYQLWLHYNQRLLAQHERGRIRLIEFCQNEDYVRAALAEAIHSVGLTVPGPLKFFDPRFAKRGVMKPGLTMPSQVADLYYALCERAGLG